MTFLSTVLAFIVALGSLIVIHELGHYWVARWCGVKVLRFTVGMGKVVFSRRFGPDQTEWAISALPLGGYVKMLDSRDPGTQAMGKLSQHDMQREFTRQSVWRRIAIVAAGPLANFLLAVLLFAGLFVYGVEEPVSKIGVAEESSAAWRAGLRNGDTVISVNGQPAAVWSELRWQLTEAALAKNGARIELDRPGRGRTGATLPADALAGIDVDGDVLARLGIGLARPAPVLGKIIEGGAAQRAGLLSGDLIVSVNGQPVPDFVAFVGLVQAARGDTMQVLLRRGGRELTLPVTPELERQGAVTVGKIKAEVAQLPAMIRVSSGPLEAVGKGLVKVWDTSVMMLRMMGRMLTGEVSLKNLNGPITIADYAGQTARIGLVSYLGFVAAISISLGVMNLLPIPVLDGGLLLYYSLEVLTGRPLPERVGEVAQRIGVGLLLTMMLLAVFNDMTRLLG